MFMDQEVNLNFLMLVHGAQEFEWFDVIRPDDVLTETGKIADIYEKGNLDFVIYEARSTQPEGRPGAQGQVHLHHHGEEGADHDRAA